MRIVNYFVPARLYDDGHKRRLGYAGVQLADFQLTGSRFRAGQKGYLLNVHDFARANAILGATVASSKEAQDGIQMVELSFGGPQAPVAWVQAWPEGRAGRDDILKIAREELLPALPYDLVIMHQEGKAPAAVRSGQLSLFLYAPPDLTSRAEVNLPPEIWGFTLPNRSRKAFTPAGTGKKLMGGSSVTLCELIGSAVYVLIDPIQAATAEELALFRLICSDLRLLLEGAEDKLTSQQTARQAERLLLLKKQFVARCCTRLDAALSSAQRDLRAAGDRVRDLTRELTLAVRKEEGLRKHVAALEGNRSEDVTRIELDFQDIVNDKKVRDIQIDGEVVTVLTNTIYCEDPRTHRYHEIGEMQIQINLEGKDHGITIRNLTRRNTSGTGGIHHPHVFEDGRLCFGNSQSRFSSLIAQHQVAQVLWLAIQFLESVNVADAYGKTIDRWPLVPADKVEALRAEGYLT